MSKIKDQLLKIQKRVEKKYEDGFKYNFKFDYDKEFVINECMLKVINKEFDVDNDKIRIVIMLLKYPKNAVIPFNEFGCVFGFQFQDICVTDSLLQSDNYEKVFTKYSELEKIVETNDVESIIKNLV